MSPVRKTRLMDLIAVALLNLGPALNRSEGETAAAQEPASLRVRQGLLRPGKPASYAETVAWAVDAAACSGIGGWERPTCHDVLLLRLPALQDPGFAAQTKSYTQHSSLQCLLLGTCWCWITKLRTCRARALRCERLRDLVFWFLIHTDPGFLNADRFATFAQTYLLSVIFWAGAQLVTFCRPAVFPS